MSETTDAAKNDLLGTAAALAHPVAGAGDAAKYLRAYFRHAPADELIAAGPERVAAVALSHAEFAAYRPQGRALVRVLPRADTALSHGRDVIDVVTDDMPFLIDSVTMEVGVYAQVSAIVHPQLRVLRDVDGTLREVVGLVDGGQPTPDELAESWTHIETAGLSAGAAEALGAALQRALSDVRVAVEDYPRMRARALALADTIGDEGEIGDVLRWLVSGNFTFLGFREYDLQRGPGADDMALCPVPGTGLGILRHDSPGRGGTKLPPQVRARALDPQRLIITKANSRSTVHRRSYLDYVAVKRVDGDGAVSGELRFLGLFTHLAYAESITRIPVLARKLVDVLAAAGLTADSHDGKDVREVLESYPRDELFMASVAELTDVVRGVLRLREQRQTRLFLRRDVYGRYMSCLVYMPRDRYNTQVRLRAQEILRQAFGGSSVDYSVMISDSPIARVHLVVRVPRKHALGVADPGGLEAQIAAAARTWEDDLADEGVRQVGERRAADVLALVAGGVPETYKTDVPASAAIGDLAKILELFESGQNIAFEMWESKGYIGGVPAEDTGPLPRPGSTGSAERVWRLSIYRIGEPVTLSDVLPRLRNMGLDVVDEHPYEFGQPAADSGPRQSFWIYDFGLRRPADIPVRQVRERVEDALAAIWRTRIVDDGFNALVLDAHLTWRQAEVLRTYARYLRQVSGRFGQDYIQRVLRANPVIARLLVRLFESRFDPDRSAGQDERSEAIAEEIRGELDLVASLDEDRILRAYLDLILATLRTNYFRGEEAGYLVFKLDAARVPGLPAPRPRFELFAYSPRFEGVHLRFAHVARGGLRWSDRPEDFRTEVLGLAKAQEVKNAVIVPSGAKGGFVCKQLPDPADRDAYHAEVLACYRSFISAMLDVTDNLVGGQIVAPPRVVRHDGDDPYLVVAADKGTATFSDTANEIALAREFWLGDAFASGGSDGYDHKKMGITARGAWESVRLHLRTLGLDVDRDDFTAVGIGDMSGDVFGNGMLLSRHIRLVAAFDHRHVFVDPSPDASSSYAERRRLSELERSSWADYSPSLISRGGGVWPRTAKSVPVSPEMRAALGLSEGVAVLTPDSLVSAILCAPVHLLWNGGIGTYVKASSQSHADVGDRSNDAVRVDGSQLRARVVAEGGNLGLTQEARVEYALGGGLVNTDFIDNTAGVDTSDHEVNIKILLDDAVRSGLLDRAARSALLHQMTDEVAGLVLEHNYRQNRALAASRAQAPLMLHVHARYMRKLERDGLIRRRLDGLPYDREIAERRSAGRGLTSPEFSVLMAHTKISAAASVLASSLPDDPYLGQVLATYFPSPVRDKFAPAMPTHPLHREIITTSVVNDMVDRAGTTFLFRLNEETGASVPEITSAWLVARAVFDMPGFWACVDSLDGAVDSSTQILAVLEGRKLTERAIRWLLHFRRPPFDVAAEIEYFSHGVLTVAGALPKLLVGRDLSGFSERRDTFVSMSVPADLAERIAAMVPAYSAFDIVDVARGVGRSVEETAEVYFDLADRLQLARLRDMITALPRDDRWNTMARAALRDDLYAAHAALARDVLSVTVPGSPESRLAAWAQRNDPAVRRSTQTLTEIWESDAFDVATLSVAVRAIRALVSASKLPA